MRIYLRALELNDYKIITEWRNDSDLTENLGGNFFFVSSEREKKSVEHKIFNDNRQLYLGICDKQSDELIGFTSINNIDLRNLKAEWGGTLIGNKDYLGKGYGKEASALMLNFLFDQYPINRCYAYCLEEHPATPALFAKLGFIKEGKLREDLFKNGEFKNKLIYSILRKEISNFS